MLTNENGDEKSYKLVWHCTSRNRVGGSLLIFVDSWLLFVVVVALALACSIWNNLGFVYNSPCVLTLHVEYICCCYPRGGTVGWADMKQFSSSTHVNWRWAGLGSRWPFYAFGQLVSFHSFWAAALIVLYNKEKLSYSIRPYVLPKASWLGF